MLGSQESPIKDAEGSRRCQVPDVPNGEKRHDSCSKHLSIEKPRRLLGACLVQFTFSHALTAILNSICFVPSVLIAILKSL